MFGKNLYSLYNSKLCAISSCSYNYWKLDLSSSLISKKAFFLEGKKQKQIILEHNAQPCLMYLKVKKKHSWNTTHFCFLTPPNLKIYKYAYFEEKKKNLPGRSLLSHLLILPIPMIINYYYYKIRYWCSTPYYLGT